MKSFVKNLIGLVFGYTIIPLMDSTFKRTVTVLLYHDIDRDNFANHIDYLSQRYSIISLREYADYLSGKSSETLPNNALIITIDDGWRGNFDLLATIKARSIPVTVFLCTGLVGTNRKIWNYTVDRQGTERALNEKLKNTEVDEKNVLLRNHNQHFREKEYDERTLLSWLEIEKMAPYVDFQSHGIFHEVLPMCNDVELHQEITGSIDSLRNITGKDVYAFAFPYGRRDQRCLEKTKEAGYSVVRTSNIPGLNSADDPAFELRSIGIGDRAKVSDLRKVETWAKVRYLVDKYMPKSFAHRASLGESAS